MKKIIVIAILLFASVASADEVKRADLAGNWYPGSKGELVYLLEGYLQDVTLEKVNGKVFAIISPHAGYRFSGPVAAYGFKAVQNQNIKTVILIGFAHRKHFDGISVYDRGSFETPLGEVKIDELLAKNIIAQDRRIFFYPDAFNGENSVEMQIPFIQMVLKDAKIVPIAFGTQDFDDAGILAKGLANVLKDRDDYLIVASTDMSHYHPYGEANSIDKHTISILNKMNAKELYDEARLGISELCGVMPVSSTLLAAEKLGYGKMRILKYANSGDTFGSKDSVVGYLSAAIYKEGESSMLNGVQKKRLLEIARESITSFVKDGNRKRFAEVDPVLNQSMGAFVTLHEGGELRGCIGNMVGEGPLYETVSDMAIQAATGDPRFSPLSPQEIERVDIEISVLSPLKKVSSHEEVKIPGHGVLVRRGFRSGVYLPQVATEAGWNKDEFLTSLCGHKAGLAPDAWKDPATEIYVFTAEIFGEKEGGAK
ncbi:MAG: AmmeMemoRadiSam system protein B [Candidatus Omnitrophica bacterium]|nr:AmmeMemoRadiSam system protein B [Candidatus Omnitrophota bacterium]